MTFTPQQLTKAKLLEGDIDELDIKARESLEYDNQQIDSLRDYFQVLGERKNNAFNFGWNMVIPK